MSINKILDLKHAKVGDRGERYEVWSHGWPKQGRGCTVGWSDDLSKAAAMADGASVAPGCTRAYVEDRKDAYRIVYTAKKK